MAPILDGTASSYGAPETLREVLLLNLRLYVLLAILAAEVVALAVLS